MAEYWLEADDSVMRWFVRGTRSAAYTPDVPLPRGLRRTRAQTAPAGTVSARMRIGAVNGCLDIV